MYGSTIVVLCLLSAAAAMKCPRIPGKFPYDESRVAGEWKVIAAANLNARCGKLVYEQKNELHKVHYTGINPDGSIMSGDLIGQYTEPPTSSRTGNTIAVWKKTDGPVVGPFEQTLVDTDYDNYGLLISCGFAFDDKNQKFVRLMRAVIISRTNTLPEETIKVLKNIIATYDVPIDKVTMVDQSNC